VLRLPPIELRRPAGLAEAAAILAGEGERARAVAGGTDLWPNLKRRHQRAEVVVSLMGIDGLAAIDAASPEARLGATARLSALLADPALVARFPALARALASISSPALRNMGTLGGNLCLDTRCTYYNQSEEWRRAIGYCLKERGETCWVATRSPRCWAQAAADSVPALCALGARVRLRGPGGERVVALETLYRDDGIDYLAKRPEELLVEVLVPKLADAEHCRATFWKLRRRGTIDFAVLSVAAAIWTAPGGTVERAALVLGAVGSAPLRVGAAEALLAGARLDEERIEEAARLAHRASRPMDNTDLVPAWRGKMVERYTRAALRELAGLPPGVAPPAHWVPAA